MLYTLGALSIDVAPFNVHDVSENGATEYASKAVVGTEPLLEFVGEGANDMSLSGRLFPRAIGGLDELEILRQMRVSGKPQYMMRGDGKPMGWYAITSVSTRSSYLDGNGIGKQIEVSISMTRAQTPAAASFFSLISGLLG
jgi:phage protein U